MHQSYKLNAHVPTDNLRLRERSHQQLFATKMDCLCILLCNLFPGELIKARSKYMLHGLPSI